MTTRDLFLPETRPASESGVARSEVPRKLGAVARQFASLMDRALDGEPEGDSDLWCVDESRREANSAGASTGDSLAPNIIMLPPASVVVPFPDPDVPSVESGSAPEDGVEEIRL